MRILVTNDDGVNAPGLDALVKAAGVLAGPDGEVCVVAPATEQSGTGHCVSFVHPMMLTKIEAKRFSTVGTPADCVLAGIYHVMNGNPPDLVLSGVNRGNNSGENAVYSGTVGAAMEGALHGIKSIALSQYYGPGNRKLADPFESARRFAVPVVRSILDHTPWEDRDYGLFFNVNFPPCAADQVAGTRIAVQGYRQHAKFTVKPQTSPSGRKFLWITNGGQQSAASPGSDVDVNLQNYISVTPMRADLTAHDVVGYLSERFA